MLTLPSFCQFLSVEFDLGGATLLDATGLYDELGLDSFDAFRLIILIEGIADVQVPPAQLPEIYTVGDAWRYYTAIARDGQDAWRD